MRLSRKGWNNVIIFSMLIMIFFLNGWHKHLFSHVESSSMQPVLPKQSFVLTLKFVDQKIERIGTGWRISHSNDNNSDSWQPSVKQLGELINLWQNIELKNINESVVFNPAAPLYVATFELAGESVPWVYLLYESEAHYYLLEKSSQRVLALDLATAKQLFPDFNFSQSEAL